MHITFYSGDTKVGETQKVQYNSSIETWQFLTNKVIAPADYSEIYVSFVYNYNTGTASVAAPFLYRESYGQSYVYDEEGNVVSSTDRAETEASFAYQDNALTQNLSPTGTRYMYSNDCTTYNTTYAVSNSGQKISFGYNESGDATSMVITDLDFITELKYASGESVTCYIVNAKNGKVLKPIEANDDSVIYLMNNYNELSEKWQIRYLSGKSYCINNLALNNSALATSESGETFKLDMLTYNSSGVPNVPFKFAIESNGDGTFKISTAKSNHTKYLYQTDNLHYSGSNSYSLRVAEYDEDDPAFKWYLVATTSGTDKMKTSADYGTDGLHLMSSTDAVGNTVTYDYGLETDADYNGLVKETTDPKGNVTSYTYDVMNKTTAVESGTSKVEYTYDKDLLKNILVDEGLVQYSFDYDSFGRKVATYVGNGTTRRTLTSYVYEGRDLVRKNYGSSGTNYISLEYDSLDRLVKKTYNGDASKYVQYLYDPNGNQYGVVDAIWGKKTLLEFDLAGRVNGVSTVDLSTKITRAYEAIRYNDGKGTVESTSHTMFNSLGEKLRTTSYSYTYGDPSRGEMPDTLYKYEIGLNLDVAVNFMFTYDDLARLQNRTLNIGTVSKAENYTYKASETAGYTTTLVESMTDFTGTLHTYTYDGNGNILTETIGDQVIEYEYDSQNRLVEYYDPVANVTGKYVYDDRGNILEVYEGVYLSKAEIAEYGWDVYGSTAYTYGNGEWADLLTQYGTFAITYDELGNPLTWPYGRNKTLTWENGRDLVKFTSSTTTYNYSYNADGLRTAKNTVNGSDTVTRSTEYYIIDGQYVGEVTTIGETDYVITYVYDENGAPAGINVNGGAYYFAKNLQGDVIALMGYDGTVVARYAYDVWGDLLSVTDDAGNSITSNAHVGRLNPFRYRGYMYDEETGFYYLRSRYYDPSVGRFINADTVVSGVGGEEQGYNPFVYCFNNPVNMDDASGNWPKWFKNAAKSIAKAIKKVVDSVEKKVRDLPVAVSTGQDLNFQVGPVSAGGAVTLAVHANGDFLLQAETSLSFSASDDLGVSSKTINEIQFVPDFDSLHSDSLNVAINATAPIPYTYISGDGSLSYKKYYSKNGKHSYPAFSLDVGAAFPSVTNTEFGGSIGISRSYDLYEFNIYDCIDKALISIIEWE